MKAHIVTVGDEILFGSTLNTNAAYIGEKMSEIEINVGGASVVPDKIDEIVGEYRRVWKKADVVFSTGGLGPTHDDRTREAVVDFFGCQLVGDKDVMEDIKERFDRLNRPLAKINEDQAMVPDCAEPIRNKRGTAPGYWIERDEKIFVAMPGVPHEMREMMETFVLPRLKERVGESAAHTKRLTLLTTGIGESNLYDKLGDIDEISEGGELAFLPTLGGVRIRITAVGETDKEADEKLQAVEQRIRGKAGRFIFGKDDETLAEVVGRLLKDRDLEIAVAESCTGGLLSSMLTDFGGASDFYERGVVSYSNASKVELLHVNEDDLNAEGAVSQKTAKQMAEGVKAVSAADVGLAITGIMGPTAGGSDKPVGLVYVAVADDDGVTVKAFNFGDDRRQNKVRAATAALDMLRRVILGISIDA
jgi:nicotinamide-nucleotide amidase